MMKRSARWITAVGLLAAFAACAQEPPRATELPGTAFTIKHTWLLGGTGSWDYLTMDAEANRLYIAHGRVVQVVDVETGAVAGEIKGLLDAHDVALDSSGEFGYVSDGPADEVKVFDRRTFQIVTTIPTGPTPRALAIDESSGLLFAVCTNPVSGTPPPQQSPQPRTSSNARRTAPAPVPPRTNPSQEIKTSISVIDLASKKRVGEILMPARLGFAQSDGNGGVFVLLTNRDQVARLDVPTIAARLQGSPSGAATNTAPTGNTGSTDSADSRPSAAAAAQTAAGAGPSSPQTSSAPASPGASAASADGSGFALLDWSREFPGDSLKVFALGSGCEQARSLAVDGAHQRLFAACNNMKLTVLNTGSGEVVASLPIGPGADTVGYDAGRGLIYTANGGAQGSLTVIRQDVTDTYAEIQNLPTRQRARTLAFNRDTGEIYLVTDYLGVNAATNGGIGTLKTVPVAGSFQVLVVGH